MTSGRPDLFVRVRPQRATCWGPQAGKVTAMVAADVREYVGSGTWLIPTWSADDVLAYCAASHLLAIRVPA